MSKFLSLALVGLLSFAAFAMPGKCGSCRGMGPGFEPSVLIEKGKEKLGLSDDQVGKIKNLWKDHQARIIKVRAEMEMAELELRNALDADELNKGKIEPLVDKVSAVRTKMKKEHIGLKIDVSNILDKDQRVKARELMREMQGKKKGEMRCPIGEKGMRGDGMGRRCAHSK